MNYLMFSNPFPKKEEDQLSAFIYPIIETVVLYAPDYIEPIDFWDVLKNRRSSREFQRLSLNEISKILWMSAKVHKLNVQDNGYILTQRPNASAGARHPIDIIVLSPILNSSVSFYYYNPFEHSLNKLNLEDNFIQQLRIHVNSILDVNDSTIIWFIAHPSRTEAKYDDAVSLIWRDAGALIQTIQLVCTSLKYNSCAVGTLGEPFISKMFSKSGRVFGVGGIVIG